MNEARRLVIVAALAGAIGGGATLALYGPHAGSRAQDQKPPVATSDERTAAEAQLKKTLAELKDASSAFRQVAKLVSPAVVHITHERDAPAESDPMDEIVKRFFQGRVPPELKERAFGSGVIVRADGLVLTNNHVAGGGGHLTAKLSDGRELAARLIGADPRSDVALIKLDGAGPFVAATLGDSDGLEVGDWVLAFGNPFGLEQTVTAGIVSAKRRSNVGVAQYEDFIQTDAAINPGNSGGPLVDVAGRVVGINTAIASRTGTYNGIGFAIPVNMARHNTESLLKAGHVVRGFLGVQAQDATPELAERLGLGRRSGALVAQVVAGSPAAAAGLSELDLIVALDGQTVDDATRLRLIAADLTVGKKVEVKVIRAGKELTLTATIAERPGEPSAAAPAPEPEATPEPTTPVSLGITAQPLTRDIARRFSLPTRTEGVVITEIAAGSLAAQAGVRPGLVIQEIDRAPVKTLDELEKAIAKIDPRAGVLLKLFDGRAVNFVLLKAH